MRWTQKRKRPAQQGCRYIISGKLSVAKKVSQAAMLRLHEVPEIARPCYLLCKQPVLA